MDPLILIGIGVAAVVVLIVLGKCRNTGFDCYANRSNYTRAA